jgi:hypothetical protein
MRTSISGKSFLISSNKSNPDRPGMSMSNVTIWTSFFRKNINADCASWAWAQAYPSCVNHFEGAALDEQASLNLLASFVASMRAANGA